MKHTLINTGCLEFLRLSTQIWTTIFADPPDNIGTKYRDYNDSLPDDVYTLRLYEWLELFVKKAQTVWLSFNARWICEVGNAAMSLKHEIRGLEVKPCVQAFTFGQHNQHDLGSNHRPLWRFRYPHSPLRPDAIRVESWRQKHRDKRADPRGRVPGDVFDFPRVTGNSKQRRPWHPTQLNEGLVERCIRLTTPLGRSVLDPFAGTGTTLRVCKKTGNPCTLLEVGLDYCYEIANEHKMEGLPFNKPLQFKPLKWSC